VIPDSNRLDEFKASAWLREFSARELEDRPDIPVCKVDLTYINKISLILEN
jgi:hypothetical protein